MTSPDRAPMLYARFHREQTTQHGCVPACVCMVMERAGTTTSEAEVCSRWYASKKGFALRDGARYIGGEYVQLDPDEPRNYEYLRAMLCDGRWVIAQMFTAELGRILSARNPPSSSTHGPLPTTDFFRHVVVLVEGTADGFWYLDPWYRTSDQPMFLDNVSFARAFQGWVAISKRLP